MRKLILFLNLLCFTLAAHAASDFAIGSNNFQEKNTIGSVYTCDGLDVSPELHWSNIPQKTQSLVLVLSDIDAPTGTFYHWIVYNIPANTTEFAEAIHEMPSGILLGKNSWNKTQYDGPCPPKGTSHRYIFTLYALNDKLTLPAGADAKTLLKTIKNHIISQTQLTGLYNR